MSSGKLDTQAGKIFKKATLQQFVNKKRTTREISSYPAQPKNLKTEPDLPANSLKRDKEKMDKFDDISNFILKAE